MKRQLPRHQSALTAPSAAPLATYGDYEGARNSPEQGWIYIPHYNPAQEIDTLSRTIVMDRTNHLYRNNGKARRIINCITRMVTGTGLIPEPMTRDQAYNDRVKLLWQLDAESPKSFSLSGRFSSSGAQRAMKRAQLRTGDAAMVATKVAGTGPVPQLQFALFDGSSIGDGGFNGSGGDVPNMRDGVTFDPITTRAQSFRFLGTGADGVATQSDIEASNVLFFASHENVAGQRGITCLAHAVNRMHTLDDIDKALGMGIRMSSYQAWAIEQQIGSPPTAGGALGPNGGARPNVVVNDPRTNQPVLLEKLLGKGQIEELAPGKTLKILTDTRPHPNVRSWKDDQDRDMIAGTDYPYEVVWKIEALGGANSRFVLADCQSKIEMDQEELCEQVLCPMYILKLVNWEARGLLQPCTDPNWWMHEWLTPPRLTVDFGRDGKIYIDQWVRGHITLKSLYGYRGEGWKRQTTQWLEELAWRKTEMKRLQLELTDLPVTTSNSAITPEAEVSPSSKPSPAKPGNNDDLEQDDDL